MSTGRRTPGTGAWHPRVRRRHALQQSRPPQHQHHQFQRALGGRHELVPVRHDVPGLERARLQPRLAQRPRRLRPAADGDRPAGGERSPRALRLHRQHHRLLGRRLHARSAAHGHPTDRSAPGPRRRLAQRVLRQRHLAGVAKPDAEPRPALRAEHARPDLRGSGVDARGGPGDHHPEHIPEQGLQVPRSELQGHRARVLAPPTASARRRSCAPASGSTTTRIR